MPLTDAPIRFNLQAGQDGLVTDLTTNSGFRFHVRPAHPLDEAPLSEFFKHVTPEDLRFRFLSGLHEVGHDHLVEMTRDDDPTKISFLCIADNNNIVATGMLAAEPDGEIAEVALAVRADMKHHGIAWSLLRYILDFAEANGIKAVESIESADHKAAINLEREMGFTAKIDPDDARLRIVKYVFDVSNHVQSTQHQTA
jgi:acetyltransferase